MTMKTEQEQIEQIEKVLKDSVADYKHLKKKGVCYCYAETLIDNGYGDVSEYKAEIERLRTTLGQCNTELNSALESLKRQCREIGELKAKNEVLKVGVATAFTNGFSIARERVEKDIRRAKIDVLNKAKEKFNAISRVLADDGYIGADIDGIFAVSSCRRKIDELIKEVQNAEDKG